MHEKRIRSVIKNGERRFVVKDICNEFKVEPCVQEDTVDCIGFYTHIFTSDLQTADKFKKWIFSLLMIESGYLSIFIKGGKNPFDLVE